MGGSDTDVIDDYRPRFIPVDRPRRDPDPDDDDMVGFATDADDGADSGSGTALTLIGSAAMLIIAGFLLFAFLPLWLILVVAGGLLVAVVGLFAARSAWRERSARRELGLPRAPKMTGGRSAKRVLGGGSTGGRASKSTGAGIGLPKVAKATKATAGAGAGKATGAKAAKAAKATKATGGSAGKATKGTAGTGVKGVSLPRFLGGSGRHAATGKTGVGKTGVGKTGVGKTGVGKTGTGKKAAAGKTPTGKAAAAVPPSRTTRLLNPLGAQSRQYRAAKRLTEAQAPVKLHKARQKLAKDIAAKAATGAPMTGREHRFHRAQLRQARANTRRKDRLDRRDAAYKARLDKRNSERDWYRQTWWPRQGQRVLRPARYLSRTAAINTALAAKFGGRWVGARLDKHLIQRPGDALQRRARRAGAYRPAWYRTLRAHGWRACRAELAAKAGGLLGAPAKPHPATVISPARRAPARPAPTTTPPAPAEHDDEVDSDGPGVTPVRPVAPPTRGGGTPRTEPVMTGKRIVHSLVDMAATGVERAEALYTVPAVDGQADLDWLIASLPQVDDAAARVVEYLAQFLGGSTPVDRRVADFMRHVAAGARATSGQGVQVHAGYRRAHTDDLRRSEQPRPAETSFNV